MGTEEVFDLVGALEAPVESKNGLLFLAPHSSAATDGRTGKHGGHQCFGHVTFSV